MDQKTAVRNHLRSILDRNAGEPFPPVADSPTVLVATIDPVISDSMRDLLQMYPLRTLWARGVGEVRALLSKENVAACFCGFWLTDGTYRDVVRLLKRRPVEIPAIIVCEPACPNEYRDYLASLHIPRLILSAILIARRTWSAFCKPHFPSVLMRRGCAARWWIL